MRARSPPLWLPFFCLPGYPVGMAPFAQASYNAQVSRLRQLATSALKHFPVRAKAMHFINHGENTTFRVEAVNGRNYLLRVHRDGYHTREGIEEELAWLAHLGKVKALRVPVPVRSRKRKLLEHITTSAVPGGRHCALFKWVNGRFAPRKRVRPEQLFELGAMIGTIQKHSLGRKTKHRIYWDAEGLVGAEPKWGSVDRLPGLHREQQKKITQFRKSVLRKLKAFERRFPARQGIIHADLHFGNFLVCEGGLGAIDFDDCGFGFHAYDLAVPMAHLEIFCRENPKLSFEALVEGLQQGYASVRPWDKHDRAILPVLFSARKLAGLGWLNSRSDNPALKKHLKGAAKNLLKHIRKQG